jgi:amicyanin
MSKTAIGVIVSALAILVIGGVVLVGNRNDGDPTTAEQTSSEASMSHSEADNTADDSAAVEAVDVDIMDSAYIPANIKVKKGSTVTWTNQDSIRHDVMPDAEAASFRGSELLGQGESYSFTFNEVGTYTYHCTPHPFMKGTVEVVEES